MEANNLVTDDICRDVLMIPIEGEEENGETNRGIDRSTYDSPDEAIVLPSSQGGFVVPEKGDPQFDLEIQPTSKNYSAEAKGEPFDGKVAVAAVIQRLKARYFPTDGEIIYQPRQFEPVQNGTINQSFDNSAYEAALNAINALIRSEGVILLNPYKVPKTSWVWTLTHNQTNR